ncbi:MAG: HIT domain-containing protein [Candidatus Edwardsbacteria bacterium]|nr:HIT domain-containing protein [Candidatus Edwardsbacteria bacterium]
MKRLWAPWRMAYITRLGGLGGSRDGGCIFCVKPKQRRDAANHIVQRGKKAFAMMNLFPYNNGHLMIAPYRHVGNFLKLTDAEMLEIMQLAQACQRAIADCMRPDGFNLGFNLGRTAGAGIAGHLHLHLVPRWNGDTNFMPVLGETKVISESLDAAYARIRKRFAASAKHR